MGTVILGGAIVLGLFLGIVLISVLSMAKETDQSYDSMCHVEKIPTPAKPLYRPASAALSPISRDEARPQRDLGAQVAAP
jgi:hypothetical protein